MNSCERFQDDLLLAESGELSARRRQTLEEHLSSCASCRTYREEVRALQQAAVRAFEVELPPALAGRVAHADAARWTGAWTPLPAPARLLAWAAGLVLALGGVWFLTTRRSERPVAGVHALLVVLADDPAWSRTVVEAERGADRDRQLRLLAQHLLTMEGMAVEDVPEDEPTGGAEPVPTARQPRNVLASLAEKCG